MTLTEVVASRYWTAAGLTMLHYCWIGALLGVFAAFVRACVGSQHVKRRYAAALGCLALEAMAPLVIYLNLLAPPAASGDRIADAAVSAIDSPALPLTAELALSLQDSPLDLAADRRSSWKIEIAAAWQSIAMKLGRALPWVWLGGSTSMLAILLTGLVGSRRLCSETRSLAGTAIDRQCRRISVSLRIGRRVLVAVSDRVVAPVVVGLWRPTVLLPMSVWTGFEPAQIEMILWHELAHVRRYDNLMNFVERIIQALLFFQPAVWLACRWVRFERENCCDAVAIEHAASPQAYAETLASLAAPGLRLNVALANSANHQLVARIRCILRPDERSSALSRRIGGWLAVLSLSVACITPILSQPGPTAAQFAFASAPLDHSLVSGPTSLEQAIGPTAPEHEFSGATQDLAQHSLSSESIAATPRIDNSTASPGTKPLGPAEPAATATASAPDAPLEKPQGELSQTESSNPEPLLPSLRNAEPLKDTIGSQETAAVKAIGNLGGWLYYDEHRRVEEVNLAYRDTAEGRMHNERSPESEEGLRLVSAFPRLKRLSLYHGQATDEALAAVSGLQELEIISSWNTPKLSDQGIQHLSGLKNLREVYFDAGRLGDGALAVFGTLPKLEVLRMLIGNEITDAGLKNLAAAAQLRELAIGQGKHPITDAGVEHLLKLSALENLNLQDSRISPSGVSRLKSLPRLQMLRVNADELYQRQGATWVQIREG